jgi:hypothetical protein
MLRISLLTSLRSVMPAGQVENGNELNNATCEAVGECLISS